MAVVPTPAHAYDAPPQVAEVLTLHRAEPEPPARGGGTEMDLQIAADWDLWSEQIGRALLPILRRLLTTTPTVTSAMIGTADGFNLCALGLDEGDVSRVSAMTSSLLSMADAVTDVVDKGEDHPLDLVSLNHGTHVTIVRAVRHLIIGQLLIWVTGDATQRPSIESAARDVANAVWMLLADD